MDNLYNHALRHRRKGQRGFTLIELLVVIAVLAILAAIVIFNVTGVTNRGDTSACNTDLKTVQTASDAFHNDNGAYSTTGGGAGTLDPTIAGGTNSKKLQPDYVHTWPTERTWLVDATGLVTPNTAC